MNKETANEKTVGPAKESFWDRQKRRRRELAAEGLYPIEEAIVPLADGYAARWAAQTRGFKRGEIVPRAIRLLIIETAALERATGNELPGAIKDWLAKNEE